MPHFREPHIFIIYPVFQISCLANVSRYLETFFSSIFYSNMRLITVLNSVLAIIYLNVFNFVQEYDGFEIYTTDWNPTPDKCHLGTVKGLIHVYQVNWRMNILLNKVNIRLIYIMIFFTKVHFTIVF